MRPLRELAGARPALAVVWFWIFATGVLAVLAVLVLSDARTRQLQDAEEQLAAFSLILSEQTARSFQSVDLTLQWAQERMAPKLSGVLPAEPESVDALLAARIAGTPLARSLFVVDREGRVRYSALGSSRGLGAQDRDYVLAHRNGSVSGAFIGPPARSRVDGEWSIFMSRRVTDDKGGYLGVVVASIPLSYFTGLYGAIKPDQSSTIGLFRRDGTMLYGEPFGDGLPARAVADDEVFRMLDRDPRRHLVRVGVADPRIVAFRTADGFPLVTTISVSERAALAAWRDHAVLVAAGMVGVVVLLALAALAFARELVHEERLAASLRDSEIRLQGIVDSALDAMISVDEGGRIVLFNPAAEQMFGCPAGTAIGRSFARFLPANEAKGVVALLHEWSGDARRELTMQRADGTALRVEASVSVTAGSGQSLYTAVMHDITDRLEREVALRESNRQLRELSGALQSVREEERARIARELHDDLGQQLLGLKFSLSWLGRRLPAEQPALQEKLGALQAQIDTTIASVRRITSELRPLLLDDLGLAAAAGWLAEDFAVRTGVEVRTDIEELEPEPDTKISSSLFRILQESLTNVARHADATTVRIALKRGGRNLLLQVADDGRGMDEADRVKPKSFGLLGIRERVHALDGRLRIESRRGAGTRLEVEVPFDEPATEGVPA